MGNSKLKTQNSKQAISRAVARYVRIAPRKVKLVLDLIRNKNADSALGILMATKKKASEIVSELIESALSNAKRKYPDEKYEDGDFYISKISADKGPSLKRFRAASMGRASRIRKRSSHILVELGIKPERAKIVEDRKTPKKKSKAKQPAKAKGSN